MPNSIVENRPDGKAYIITGPTSGIGRRTAFELAKHGTVVLVGPREGGRWWHLSRGRRRGPGLRRPCRGYRQGNRGPRSVEAIVGCSPLPGSLLGTAGRDGLPSLEPPDSTSSELDSGPTGIAGRPELGRIFRCPGMIATQGFAHASEGSYH